MLQLALHHPPGQQVQAEAMDATREDFAEKAAAPGQQLQYQQDLRDEDATWEYFEKGGWFAMDDKTSKILSMAYSDENTECSMTYTDEYKYIWNFEDMTQKRFRFDGHTWTCVKTRSIRRVQVLATPVFPRG